MKIFQIAGYVLVSLFLGTTLFGFITGSVYFAEAQDENQNFVISATDEFVDIIFKEILAIAGSFLALGVGAVIRWMQKQGVPITDAQEAMFKQVVTERFQMLAKDSWSKMREAIRNDPKAMDNYWDELKTGHVPKEFRDILQTQGLEFAKTLKENKEFRDFTGKITDTALERLLKNVRVRLKADYQKRMVDVIPKIAGIAVDAVYDKEVKDVETWSNKALEEMKPLIFSTEALDSEDNLLLIIRSEVNKRLQKLG